MNSLLKSLTKDNNYTYTENGGVAVKSTLNAVYDMFALAGSYRTRSDEDCIFLFKKALEENPLYALKCLFYIRNCRGGAGERRFFRVCFRWLAQNYPEIAKKNIPFAVIFGRWDDLYCLVGTSVENYALKILTDQLKEDYDCVLSNDKEGVSLAAKWAASENASAAETKRLGNRTRQYMGISHKDYRKMLSVLRERINIVERLMSEGRWGEIEYSKIPSKAGLVYRNAFAKNDAERYKAFIENKNTKVNAGTLYPYEIVEKVIRNCDWNGYLKTDEVERQALNKYWENQIDYLKDSEDKLMCVVDTSGSMWGRPISIAISLGMYCAERLNGDFKNHYIAFSSRPYLVKVEGIDFCDKVNRIYKNSIVDNTNLTAVFRLLLNKALESEDNKAAMPTKIVVISDMEIDAMSTWGDDMVKKTEMARIRAEYAAAGVKMPQLIYWNADARNDVFLEDADTEGISYVSGASASMFKSILTGKTGIQLMLEVLDGEDYNDIDL